jgi:hypothetical protein
MAYQVLQPRKITQRPGGHHRHRREEPREVRPVAVAAHARRRSGPAPDRSWRGCDRLRYRVCGSRTGCRPAIAADTRSAIWIEVSRDRLQGLAEQRSRCSRTCAAEVAGGARRVRPAEVRSAAGAETAADRPGDVGQTIQGRSCCSFRACCGISRSLRRRRPGAGCSPSGPSATASSAAFR